MATRTIPALESNRAAVSPLTGGARDYDPLLNAIGDARFVLLGEASHGTHEFYRERAEITQAADQREGLHRRCASRPTGPTPTASTATCAARATTLDADEALARLQALPDLDVAQHRRASTSSTGCATHNDALPRDGRKAGFYGLDLYSLHTSMEAVLGYLDKVDPEAAAAGARAATPASTISATTRRPMATAASVGASRILRGRGRRPAGRAAAPGHRATRGATAASPRTSTSTPSRTRGWCKNAEDYYRSMFRGRVSSWNLRDRHMAETLDALVAHLETAGGSGRRIVVWAHNSHLGDARATEMGAAGRAQRRPARARAARRDAVPDRLQHLPRHRHRRLRLGRAGRAQARPPGARRAATRRCSTTRGGSAALPARLCARTATRWPGAARAAARAGDRRHLPARDRAHEPLLPGPAAGSVRRVLHFDETARCSRWSGRQAGTKASCRRHIRSPSERPYPARCESVRNADPRRSG